MEKYQLSRDYKYEKKVYPFADMTVGDSFFAPVDAKKLRSAATYFCKYRNGIMLKVRKEGFGARCYRIA